MTRTALAAVLVAAGTTAVLAAAPSGLDSLPTGITPMAPVAIGGDNPATAPQAAQRPRGNPLWGVPLSVLSATRERPIFLPSRRPIAPVVATQQPVAAPVAAAPAPEQPRLALVGAIVRDDEEAIAIFIDQSNNSVVRLRTGQKHGDWELSVVKGRSATFQKGGETLTVELPAPGTAPRQPPGMAGVPVIPAAATTQSPAAGSGAPETPSPASAGAMVVPDPSMGVPFVPRSTPKNGESDGL